MECKFWLLAVTLSSLYAATRTDHISEMLAAEKTCMTKYTSITPAVLNEMKDVRDYPRFQASHPEINCFMFCIGLEMKLVDDAGVLHIENLRDLTVAMTKEKMTHDEAHQVITQCSDAAVHEDVCEKAGQYVVCKSKSLREYELHVSRHD